MLNLCAHAWFGLPQLLGHPPRTGSDPHLPGVSSKAYISGKLGSELIPVRHKGFRTGEFM